MLLKYKNANYTKTNNCRLGIIFCFIIVQNNLKFKCNYGLEPNEKHFIPKIN